MQKLILEDIENFLDELGHGFTFIKSEYPIKLGNRYNYIDLLIYNIKYKCYVVIELKVTELKKEHTDEIITYMNYIDKKIKTIEENKTIGIIICKYDTINNGSEIMSIVPELYGKIVCAALLHNNCIYMGKESHHVIFSIEPLGVLRCAVQGFVTEYVFFVDRETGLYIAKYFNQINVKYYSKDRLVSEDLKKENLKVLKYNKKYIYKEKTK